MLLDERASKIRLFIMDVDGVLTDGRIIYDNFGDELKFFDVHDGLGLALLSYADIKTAIVTAKKSKIVKRRAKETGITHLFMNVADKGKVYYDLLKKYNIGHENICCMGDDIIDAPMMKKAGLAVTVPNAVAEVKQIAHYVTQRPGGKGAVREAVELILKSQQKWEDITRRWLG
ncbi:MAG: 3-deoxy-D-manno-octulosonate 8-phosphate phosphatase [Candidatus Omnitrophica bacterium CG12_big_fil_rev_8_21_14_0_65_43_15]|uniref:3-deoxy-D-manno-octulosonate 8-phosphate phosphatase KdsC n=1 Tax=Candidatus Taenaricola geysiri TaxID=1974752 RepID=A0A2J0LFV6_9BACT|nr:MAG: 3-deoxy-D-manno-octulosonate 8-phosphate phosphatase [Candidatus Omnitrophica bacterium CG12_big_fil_rev_8_21_14_0_65_43_15]PIY83823.1 MAG: 3-deoxy-D-manno-octulosonate 8-phosphate phosphatase [Candidatus Omnitrophica bacterium CG_4_10_14_0_8_um_filter_43_18]PJC46555.1 MAG: 3-deoxy-D-manno-octulosonate 8-phosphate phosphatase [Candidatus Omnitrophica bacterium CG_4_9_14_0_2_um_filter_43_12]